MYEINVSINAKLVFRCGQRLMYVQLQNGGYNIPGGHLEQGESPIEGLRRELQEELNYQLLEEPTLVGV